MLSFSWVLAVQAITLSGCASHCSGISLELFVLHKEETEQEVIDSLRLVCSA